MFLKFSDECQKLLLLSLKEKNGLNDSFIGSEHVFLAALSMKNSSIYNLLNDFEINYKDFKSYLKQKNSNDYSNYYIFTPLMNNIFSNLSNIKKSDISSSDIIIEILNNVNSKANLILRKMNVDIKKILKKLNINNKKRKNKKGILADIGINLNEKVICDNNILLGREEEIDMIVEVLCCKNKNNPILIGEAGVGKTAIVEELARRMEEGNVPFKLKDKKIYSVSMACLVAGTKYRGEFEEKINKLIMEVENNEDIILFIDEIHTLVGAGGADGAIDASNILKPSLARGNIKIIGATTVDEYKKYFSEDKALNRRFRNIYIKEPDVNKTKDILLGIRKIYEDFHNVVISENIIERVVYFANKYIKNKKFPDKAIDILDEICVLSSFSTNKQYNIINNLDKEINNIIQLKNKALIMGDYKSAIKYSKDEKILRSKIGKIKVKNLKFNKTNEVSEDVLLKVMERKTSIPFFTYKYENNKFLKLIKDFNKNFIFSDDIYKKINSFVLDVYSNMVNGCINKSLFISSNDININNYLINDFIYKFFNKSNHVLVDINNFKDIDDLLYNNCYHNKNNSFLEKIKEYPFSVVVINNYDKCDLSIKDFFEYIKRFGYFLDNNNEKIDFSNVLFIYNILNNDNFIGFNYYNKILNGENYIDINGISESKLKKAIINKCNENNYIVSKNDINTFCKKIISNTDNLNNIEFFIRKEFVKINKNRSIKV